MHFKQNDYQVCCVWGILLYIFPVQEGLCHWNLSISAFYSYACASYNGVCIDICMYDIQYNCWLYFILVILLYIYLVHGLLYYCFIVTSVFVLICLWMFYICFLQYVGVIYMIYSLVVFHSGKNIIHVSCIWFVMSLLPYSLTFIHNSGLTSLFLNEFSHSLKHIYSFLIYQYLINLFIFKVFLLFPTLWADTHFEYSTL